MRRAKKSAELISRQQVRQMLRSHDLATREMKFGGATGTGFATTTPSVTLLTGLVQGDNVTDRDGWQINLTEFDMNITMSVGSTSGEDYVRLIIFVDTLNTGASPSATDVLGSDVRAFYNIQNTLAKRFRFLHDEIVRLVHGANNQSAVRRIVKKFNDLPLTFDGTASTDIYKNALYMYIVGGTATNDTAWSTYFRFRYYDS